MLCFCSRQTYACSAKLSVSSLLDSLGVVGSAIRTAPHRTVPPRRAPLQTRTTRTLGTMTARGTETCHRPLGCGGEGVWLQFPALYLSPPAPPLSSPRLPRDPHAHNQLQLDQAHIITMRDVTMPSSQGPAVDGRAAHELVRSLYGVASPRAGRKPAAGKPHTGPYAT